jgi:polysaccharide biosynthesis transport protein
MSGGMDLQRHDGGGPPGGVGRTAHPAPVAEDQLGGTVPVREYVEAIVRYAWLVVLVTVLAIGIAAYRTNREPARYQATASVRLIDARPAIAGNLADTWNERTMGGWTDPIRTQIEVLKSRAVVEAVVERSGYRLKSATPELSMDHIVAADVPRRARPDTIALVFRGEVYEASADSERARARYGELVEVAGVQFAVERRPPLQEAVLTTVALEAAIAEVSAGLVISPREYTSVIDIAFSGYDPHVATRVANAAAIVFEQTSTTTTQQQSARRRQFITEQLRVTDSLLAISENQLTAFREQLGRRIPAQVDAGQAGLAETRRRRSEMQNELQVYRQLLEQLAAAGGVQRIYGVLNSPELRQNPGLAQLTSDLLRYAAQRDSLTTGVVARTARHPEVQRLDTLLAATRQQLAAAVQGHESVLRARLGLLDAELARGSTDLALLPGAEVGEARLAREVETVRRLSDRLREELQAARIAEAVEIGQVQIIDLAPYGYGPLGRGTRRKLLFGALLGLTVGSFAALGMDRLNTTIRHRDEVERALGLPELATIPQLAPTETRPGRLALRRLRGQERTEVVPAGLVAPLGSISSYGAESYRKLMANLIFTPNADYLKTLVLTSPLASEGKTTTATHLAIAFAQHGRRVLLVDADLRRGRLHQMFRVDRSPGLTEIIIGDETIEGAVRQTSNPNLSLLPSGAPPHNPLEFLGSDRMQAFMDRCAELFDMVIIDTAPVLLAADTVALASKARGVLLVLRVGATQRASARHAKQQLEAVGARVIGAVLNDADSHLGSYVRYSTYYTYQYVADTGGEPGGGDTPRVSSAAPDGARTARGGG